MSENPYAAKPWLKFYDEGVPTEIDLPEMNIYEFIDEAAKEFGSRTAIWFLEHKISYKKFKDIAERLATALVNLGVKKGDVVAIMLPNFPQFPLSFYGIQKAGARVTACSVLHTEHELAYQLNDSGAEIIIAGDAYLDKIINIKDRTRLRHIIISNVFDYAPMANPGMFSSLNSSSAGHKMAVSKWLKLGDDPDKPSSFDTVLNKFEPAPSTPTLEDLDFLVNNFSPLETTSFHIEKDIPDLISFSDEE